MWHIARLGRYYNTCRFPCRIDVKIHLDEGAGPVVSWNLKSLGDPTIRLGSARPGYRPSRFTKTLIGVACVPLSHRRALLPIDLVDSRIARVS